MGRLLGRSVVRMEHYRSILSTYVASDQVKNMHPELRDGFTKFSKLQNELRSASVNPIHTFQCKCFDHSSKGLFITCRRCTDERK